MLPELTYRNIPLNNHWNPSAAFRNASWALLKQAASLKNKNRSKSNSQTPQSLIHFPQMYNPVLWLLWPEFSLKLQEQSRNHSFASTMFMRDLDLATKWEYHWFLSKHHTWTRAGAHPTACTWSGWIIRYVFTSSFYSREPTSLGRENRSNRVLNSEVCWTCFAEISMGQICCWAETTHCLLQPVLGAAANLVQPKRVPSLSQAQPLHCCCNCLCLEISTGI